MRWRCSLDDPPRIAQVWIDVRQPALRQRHQLDGLWQLHVYHHGGRLSASTPHGAVDVRLSPGCLTVLPPGAASSYDLEVEGRFSVVHFALPEAGDHRLPGLLHLGRDAEVFAERLDAAAAVWVSEPRRGDAQLWPLLWELAAPEDAPGGMPALVAQACERIEQNLGDPPTVQQLARRGGVSPGHLRRLFQAELGMGVKAWILQRRYGRALHLLRHTTLPVRDIAAAVGQHDLQAFNKTVRRLAGAAPRALRGTQRLDRISRTDGSSASLHTR